MPRNAPHPWYVYILECENGSYYTGITDDMARRFAEHRKGTARSKFTRSFRPIRIAVCWRVGGVKGAALKIELLIKGLDRAAKDSLIIDPDTLSGYARIRGIDADLRPVSAPVDGGPPETARHDILCYTPTDRDAGLRNPYLDDMLGLVREGEGLERHEQELRLALKRPELVSRYAFSIPTGDILEPIAAHSPLIELGAGTGYWAMCLTDAGADIIAFDKRPPGEEPPGEWYDANRWFDDTWFAVGEGDEAMAGHHPGRSLLLCWPPLYDPMAAGALERYRAAGGKTLIYIGCPGGCGDDEFSAALASMEPVLSMELWSWPGIDEKMAVYRFG